MKNSLNRIVFYFKSNNLLIDELFLADCVTLCGLKRKNIQNYKNNCSFPFANEYCINIILRITMIFLHTNPNGGAGIYIHIYFLRLFTFKFIIELDLHLPMCIILRIMSYWTSL